MDLPRGTVRSYSAQTKTGIQSSCLARLQYPIKALERTIDTFNLSCLRDANPAPPSQLDQLADDAVFNFLGTVHEVGAPPGVLGSAGGLPRRSIVLQNAIELTGALSSYSPESGKSVLVLTGGKHKAQLHSG